MLPVIICLLLIASATPYADTGVELLLTGEFHGDEVSANDGENAFIGQWIWSSTDAKVFNDTRRSVTDLVPCVWVSTISASDGKVSQRLANPPDLAGHSGPVAVIIRFEDSFNSVWETKATTAVAAELDERLGKLPGLLADTGADVLEVQLDFDCPVRLLEGWSKVVRSLKESSLKGRDVWITSLPCHIEVPSYGSWFRGTVSGHIIQVFDTGLTCDESTVDGIADSLRKQELPFRLGLGAFERMKGSKSTDHRQWFNMLPEFSSIKEFRGVWVFPGGRQWGYLL